LGKISNPINISKEYNLDRNHLLNLGVIDVLLTADTNLFIDPLLLEMSSHKEISTHALSRYRNHFEIIIKLLRASKEEGDVAWRNARRKFQFHEISWTCLGYGGNSTRGSGFGNILISTTLETAKEIIDLGIDDVDLFMALALFEEGIGPDRISDMVTNIILPDLIDFNKRILEELGVYDKAKMVKGYDSKLLINTHSKNKEPILLVPSDILRDLPIASDWSDISRVVSENEDLRNKVNALVGEIWATMTRKDKRQLKQAALKSKSAFESIIELLHSSGGVPYNIKSDINGELFWSKYINSLSEKYPFDLHGFSKKSLSLDQVYFIVGKISEQFKWLIEERGLWRDLWDEKQVKTRKEKAAQRLFFVVADSYCKSNNLDLTPEADTGNGAVDFKVSSSGESKVLVEIKLSTGTVVHGYEKQLEIYKDAEQTKKAYFIVVDIGGMGSKDEKIIKKKNEIIKEHGVASEIIFVDGTPKESASIRA
jgi:hypothetical protein